MTIPTSTTSQYGYIVQYLEAMTTWVTVKEPVLNLFKRSCSSVIHKGRGFRAYQAFLSNRASNIVAGNETYDTYPEPVSTTMIEGYTDLVAFRSSIGMTDLNEAISQSDRARFSSILALEAQQHILANKADMAVRLYTGKGSMLAKVKGNCTTTTVNTYGPLQADTAQALGPGVRFLNEGQKLIAYTDVTLGSEDVHLKNASGVYPTVSNIGRSARRNDNQPITISDTPVGTVEDTRILCAYAEAINLSIEGIQSWLSDYTGIATWSHFGWSAEPSTLYGLSRTTYPKLNANIINNSGTLRPLTTDLFMDTLAQIFADNDVGDEEEVSYVGICDPGIYNEVMKIIATGQQFQMGTVEYRYGVTGISFVWNGLHVALMVDKRWFPGSIGILRLSDWEIHIPASTYPGGQAAPDFTMHDADPGEGPVRLNDATTARPTDKFMKIFKSYVNLSCKNPYQQTFLADLQGSSRA